MKSFFPAIILLVCSSASAQLNADFSASGTQGCSPVTVQFKDNSTGSPTSWFWDFGNGITSSLQNPSVTYTSSGNYSVRLIVRNSIEQNLEEKANYITVFATPAAHFQVISGDSGCVVLQSAFQDTTDFFNAPVKSWQWDFNDGSTSNQQSPMHTFTSAGKYNVSLTVETTQGCSAKITKKGAVKAGNKPVADFSAAPLSGCASVIRNFTNKSSGNITASLWEFGDGGRSLDKNPLYHYQDTGTFNVKLKVSENGCKDSITISKYIHVDGPVAKFRTRIDCSDRFTIRFFDSSIAEVTRLWDFGDGQTSTIANVVHVYNSPGIYYAKLIITGTVCSDTARDTIRIKVTNPVLQISPVKSFYCKYDTIRFITSNYDTVNTKFFSWNFGDNIFKSSNLNSIVHVYENTGNFKPIGYIRDNESCTDTVTFNGKIIVNGPTANFAASAPSCTNSVISFKEASTASGSQITQWLWNYGDGITEITNGSSSYNYAFAGAYNVNLKVTDANGCSDSLTDTINIFQTPTVDAGIDTFACANTGLTLNPTGASSYVWLANPDLSCTNCTNPIATPTQPVTYYVTGTSSDGCTASDSVKVAVQTKELIAAQPNSYSICAGDSVMLNASGTDSYNWTPAITLSNPSISNPIAFPVTNTAYTVTGKDSNNCFSDMTVVNVIVNPGPTVNILDSSIQALIGSTYTIITTASVDAQNPVWSPATDLSCYNCLQPVATVNKTTTYTLKVSNQYGCIDSDKITIISVCTNESVFLPNTFSPNNDGMNDYFFPRTGSDINIVSLTVFNRWGQMVFQKRNFSSNNAANGWDGKYKNVLQNPDVYVYVMALQCSGNSVFLKKGDITLIR